MDGKRDHKNFKSENGDKMETWRKKKLVIEQQNKKLKDLVKRHKKILAEFEEAKAKKLENTEEENNIFLKDDKIIKNKIKQIEESDYAYEKIIKDSSSPAIFSNKNPALYKNKKIIRKNDLDWIIKAKQMQQIDEEDSENDWNEERAREFESENSYPEIAKKQSFKIQDILNNEEQKKLDIQRRLKKIQAQQLEKKLKELSIVLENSPKLPQIKKDEIFKKKNPQHNPLLSIVSTQTNDDYFQSRYKDGIKSVRSHHSSFTPPPRNLNIDKLTTMKHQYSYNTHKHNSLSNFTGTSQNSFKS